MIPGHSRCRAVLRGVLKRTRTLQEGRGDVRGDCHEVKNNVQGTNAKTDGRPSCEFAGAYAKHSCWSLVRLLLRSGVFVPEMTSIELSVVYVDRPFEKKSPR